MKAADDKFAQLGMKSLNCVMDSYEFRSAQHRERLRASWMDVSVRRDANVYDGVLHALKEGPLPISAFLVDLREAQNDWWLCRRLNKRQCDGGSLVGTQEFVRECRRCNVPAPPGLEDELLPTTFKLTEDTVMLHVDHRSLKLREAQLLYTKFVAHQLLIKHAPGAYVVVALDRSLSRWSDMIDKISTIDPGVKFYLIRQHGEGQRFIRPLLVKELFGLMCAHLSEIYTTTELADLVSRVPHRTMCRVLGSAHHLAAELAHWVASICSADRLIPRGADEILEGEQPVSLLGFRCWGFVVGVSLLRF